MKRKTGAIITLYDNFNFGNRLQNYGVQKYFEGLGMEMVTLPYREKVRPHTMLITLLFRVVHIMLRPTAYEKKRGELLRKMEERRTCIMSFSGQHIKNAPMLSYRRLPHDLATRYDYFITGSDQVWHCWQNNHRELKYFLLMFAKPSQRITMAPSFGFDEFPRKYLKTYKQGLEGFEFLSTREERGAELIKNLTGKDATVLLDPTMLIDTSEWLKILKKPSQYTDEKYILVYAIGGFKGEVKDKTCILADELNLQVIDIMDIDSDYYIHTRPDEFLYWIYNAKLVITDSFHASVFSILFSRPFAVYDRTDHLEMGSRLDTLLGKFGLEDRKYEVLKAGFGGEDTFMRQKLFTVDYSNVPEVLKAEREKTAEFYRKCFEEK